MEQLYVLECSNNKYYIGKTTDVMRRYEEHKSGRGSAWTSKYKPIKMLLCRPLEGVHDENNITKDYMKKYGIEHVRGGIYTQMVLPPDVLSVLQREFQGTDDKCYKCNLAGHFAGQCTNIQKVKKAFPPQIKKKEEEWGCSYCDRTFTTRYGCSVHERSCKEIESDDDITCYRCGNEGHYSTNCYAKKHVDGSWLG
jgi:predicted GIY-YIG superfamily endonuclease